MTSYFNKSIIFLLFSLINLINCWPNLRLYSNNDPKSYKIITTENLESSEFDRSKLTYFFIHGFSDPIEKNRFFPAKNKIISLYDTNVIIVDWEKGAAAPNYIAAATNTKIVAKYIANFIIDNQIDPKLVHCVGHSLGAHTCGYIGKRIKLGRISGLDPAGPLFIDWDNSERLYKTDADFVDVMHTDVILGIQTPLGHKDFYPNGGKGQPGCFGWSSEKRSEAVSLDMSDFFACSHIRAVTYFIESIGSNCKFTSTPCGSWEDHRKGKCSCGTNGCSSMGFNASDNKQEGLFFLNVNRKDPFCIN